MKFLIILLVVVDAVVFPTKGILASVMFVTIPTLSLWRLKYRDLFIISLILISSAVGMYLIGGQNVEVTMIHKLSDWTLIFLLLGTVRLALVH